MSRSRAVGSAFARMVCEFLAEAIPGVERRVDGGSRDRGDVAGLDADGWVLECKREKALDLATALNEAKREAANAKVRWYAAVCYRRRSKGHPGGVAGSYVAMPLSTFREVLAELRRLRREVEKLREAA